MTERLKCPNCGSSKTWLTDYDSLYTRKDQNVLDNEIYGIFLCDDCSCSFRATGIIAWQQPQAKTFTKRDFAQLVRYHYELNFHERDKLYLSMPEKFKGQFVNYLHDAEIPIEGAFYELDESKCTQT